MKRNQFLQVFALALGMAASAASLAQGYPNKPIRLIVPFPAAGATDLFARTLGQKMGEKLGTTLVVDNKPGAGGAIGSDQAAKAAPDGYTILLATTSTHSIGPAINKLPYDTVRDFTPIAHVGDAASIMLVPVNSPAKTVREWIDYAKKNPGKLNYASSGNGTIVQLTAELFKAMGGSPLAPELPPIADTLPGYESNTWFGFYGPKNLPADIVAKVNKAANEALADPDVKEKLARLGIEPATPGTPDQFAKMVAVDAAKWKKIVVDRKITNE
jgi:tripartite-type tricarboxylate transporter receptor subunit TctC